MGDGRLNKIDQIGSDYIPAEFNQITVRARHADITPGMILGISFGQVKLWIGPSYDNNN